MENFAPDVVLSDLTDEKEPLDFLVSILKNKGVFSIEGILKKNGVFSMSREGSQNKEPLLDEEKGFINTNIVPKDFEQTAYNQVVSAQARIEEALVEGLLTGELEGVTAIVHTPRPCNPLSYTENNRSTILEALLKAGGNVVCVFQDKNELGKATVPPGVEEEAYLKATARFKGFMERYPVGLDSFAVNDPKNELATNLSGASYLIKTKAGKEFFVSLQSYQVQTLNDGTPKTKWTIWAGPTNDPAIAERMNDVNSFLMEKTGVNLPKFLERSITMYPNPQPAALTLN